MTDSVYYDCFYNVQGNIENCMNIITSLGIKELKAVRKFYAVPVYVFPHQQLSLEVKY